MPLQACPHCGAKLEAATPIHHNHRPEPETSITVCLYCAAVLTWKTDFTLRELPESEWRALPPDVVELLERTRRVCGIVS
jgi:hypothetical protein